MMPAKKITLATIKAFVRRNRDQLWISNGSSFDGMVDCVMECSGKWRQAEQIDRHVSNTLGVGGAWFVLRSNDWFSAFEADGFQGYAITNSCGSFRLAVRSKA